jgi:hypothetical protein
MGINCHFPGSHQADNGYPQLIRQLNRQVSGSRHGDKNRDVPVSYLKQYLGRNPAAGNYQALFRAYIFHEALAEDFIHGIVPAYIIMKNQNAFQVTEGVAL